MAEGIVLVYAAVREKVLSNWLKPLALKMHSGDTRGFPLVIVKITL